MTEPICGMLPYTCTYTGTNGAPFGVTLYGTDEQNVIVKYGLEFPDLVVEGEYLYEVSDD